MISTKNLYNDEIEQIHSGKMILDAGIYLLTHRDAEDSGWIETRAYRYYAKGGKLPLWIIEICGKKKNLSVLFGKSVFIESTRESFLGFAKEKTPEAFDWILFNLSEI